MSEQSTQAQPINAAGGAPQGDPAQTQANTPAQQETQQGASTTQAQAAQARTFTQDEVNGLIAEQKRAWQNKTEAAAQKARSDAEAAALVEQGKYKELYDKAQADLAAQQAEVARLQRESLIGQVVTETGLPVAFAARLQGATKDELIADAKSLLAAMPKQPAPNINSSNQAAPGAGALSPEALKERAARFGVNPRYLQ